MDGTETNTTNDEAVTAQATTDVDTDTTAGPDDEGDNGGETTSVDGDN